MVQTDKTAESVAETLKELRGLIGARQPTDVEIKAAKDTLVLTLPGSNETSREVATSYADILTYGLPDSYLNEFVGKVDALSASDLQAAAGKAHSPGCAYLDHRRDVAAIEAPVRKLSLGEVKVLDTDGAVLR